mgnify:CR=1 FL=1
MLRRAETRHDTKSTAWKILAGNYAIDTVAREYSHRQLIALLRVVSNCIIKYSDNYKI